MSGYSRLWNQYGNIKQSYLGKKGFTYILDGTSECPLSLWNQQVYNPMR